MNSKYCIIRINMLFDTPLDKDTQTGIRNMKKYILPIT